MFNDSIFSKLYKFLYFLSNISWYVFLGGYLNILTIFTAVNLIISINLQ